MWTAFVLAFSLLAAVSDVRSRKMPHAFTVLGIIVGIVFHAWRGELASALVASFLGFGLGLTLFRLGAIGGGDVKLITALGALLGFQSWLVAMEAAWLVAGIIALVQIARRRAFRQTLRNMGEILRGLRNNGLVAHPVINVRNQAMIRAPFGVAAAVGTLIAVVRP